MLYLSKFDQIFIIVHVVCALALWIGAYRAKTASRKVQFWDAQVTLGIVLSLIGMGLSIRDAGQAGGSDVLSVVGPSVGLKMWHTAAGILISELGKFLGVPPGGTQTEMVKQLAVENAEQIRAATEELRREISKTQEGVERIVDQGYERAKAALSTYGESLRHDTEEIASQAVKQMRADSAASIQAMKEVIEDVTDAATESIDESCEQISQTQIKIVRDFEKGANQISSYFLNTIKSAADSTTTSISRHTQQSVSKLEAETQKTTEAIRDTGSEVSKQMRDAANDAMFKAVETVNTAADTTATAVAKVGQTVYAHMSQMSGQFDQQLQRLEAVAQRSKT